MQESDGIVRKLLELLGMNYLQILVVKGDVAGLQKITMTGSGYLSHKLLFPEIKFI